MQGRVFQRTQGRGKPWTFLHDLPTGPDGRRRQRMKGGFKTKAEAERSTSCIVVGGRPHRAVGSALLGSVATALVHHFRGSVLVVRGEDDSEWITSEYTRDKARMERAIDAIYGETYSA